jgi:uncharacterized protein YsxB (DUF464 family)
MIAFLFSKRGIYMIKITVGISKEHIAVKCVGHANYNICGEDIVCSAISTLLQTLCYSLEELTPNKINTFLEKGEGYIGIYHPTCKAITLVKGFMIGCREISNRYPDYVQLEIKE